MDAKYKIKSFEVGITYGGGMKISNSKNNIIDNNKKQLLKVAGKGVTLVYISDLIIVGKNNERIEINSLMLK
ncbi:MAG: hypothetical protein K9J13_03265 [Saprospiraceae bacterium]|nr:hypothetical protein [Saprospiraceae bacterium]